MWRGSKRGALLTADHEPMGNGCNGAAEAGSELPRGSARPLLRRRSLPGGRAVVGGLLVAVAAVGIFAAYSGMVANHKERFVVTRRDLMVGSRIERQDLGTAPIDLSGSPATVQSAFRDPASLIGNLVIAPLRAGQLVQLGNVAGRGMGSPDRQMSFPVSTSRAVGGALEVGDRVDVMTTFGSGTDALTMVVAQGLRVIGHSDASAALTTGNDPTEIVTLALSPDDNPLALAQAANSGTVLLVRSTGAPPMQDTTPYRDPTSSAVGTGASTNPIPKSGPTSGQ